MKPWIFAAALLCLTGCYSTNFMPYAGQQQEWKTSPGALMAEGTVIPAYYGWPPKHYQVLGEISIATASVLVDTIHKAAIEAKQRGADAICVIGNSSRYAGTYTTGSASAVQTSPTTAFASGTAVSVPIHVRSSRVIAIKFD